jgi:DNA-binding transcriptional LysR family regulator
MMKKKAVAREGAAMPRITLEQWRCLAAVVEAGGYAQAAEMLHKSQSSVTYAVQKLEKSLGVKAFEIQGRKAVLTTTGEMLYRRARILIEDAGSLERAARKVSAGWETQITVAMEVIFPVWLMLECLDQFGAESPQTRIELFEHVLGGTPEALVAGQVDLAISAMVPAGFTAEPLLPVRFVPVASPRHALHRLNRKLTLRDLRKHRHLVVRDSGSRRATSPTIEVEQRWTLTNMSTSIGALSRGFGFAWLPEYKIHQELANGTLKVLPLNENSERIVQLYLILADRDEIGPGALRLAEIFRDFTANACKRAGATPEARAAAAAG